MVIVDTSLCQNVFFFAVAGDSLHCSSNALGDNDQEIIASTFTRSVSHAIVTWLGACGSIKCIMIFLALKTM